MADYSRADLPYLSQLWLDAKEAESVAVERRRQLEDELARLLAVNPASEGQETTDLGDYKVKVTCRMTRKVDADLLQDLALNAGLSDHLPDLFRWKPELNMKEWKSASPEITSALSGAITTTAGRPSFSIETKEK